MIPFEKRELLEKLKRKYRLVILDDLSFEEKASVRLSRVNAFVFMGLMSIVLGLVSFLLISITPLREYVPGYTSVNIRKQLLHANLLADSLANKLVGHQAYFLNLNNILLGKPASQAVDTAAYFFATAPFLGATEADSVFRERIEQEERYNLFAGGDSLRGLSEFAFFPPLNGLVVNSFVSGGAQGVQVAATHNEAIKATLAGTVVFSGWTPESSHVIVLQHQQELISVYKNNSSLLCSVGEIVQPGEAIALIHPVRGVRQAAFQFELWHHGVPVDPQQYITF